MYDLVDFVQLGPNGLEGFRSKIRPAIRGKEVDANRLETVEHIVDL